MLALPTQNDSMEEALSRSTDNIHIRRLWHTATATATAIDATNGSEPSKEFQLRCWDYSCSLHTTEPVDWNYVADFAVRKVETDSLSSSMDLRATRHVSGGPQSLWAVVRGVRKGNPPFESVCLGETSWLEETSKGWQWPWCLVSRRRADCILCSKAFPAIDQ
jgi:hypothetical protein